MDQGYCLIRTITGEGVLNVNDKEIKVQKGDLLVVRYVDVISYMLLTTNNTLEAIAEDLQYSSSFYMSSEFKKQYHGHYNAEGLERLGKDAGLGLAKYRNA